MDSNFDIVPTLRMFDGLLMGQAADEIERLRALLADGGKGEAVERALVELVNKIDTALDTGDLLNDARRASVALDSILSGGDLVACAHQYLRDSGDSYEKCVEFRIGWNACLDAIRKARAAAPQAECAPREDDLSALVARLARALRKAAPDNDLSEKALDYLKRKGLEGSRLRECAPREAQPVAKIDADGDFVWLVHNPKFAEGTEFYAVPTPERADAEKDAAPERKKLCTGSHVTCEGREYCLGYPSCNDLRAILAAKEKKS